MYYTLTSPCGTTVSVQDQGAGVHRVSVPDRSGCFSNIALSPCARGQNPSDTAYAGLTLGPSAGRIPESWLLINGQRQTLPPNEGTHHLHGGAAGLSGKRWQCVGADKGAVRFVCDVEAGADGYPGNRHFITDYSLSAQGSLTIRLRCETDAPTWVNLSNHLYWNLSGDFTATVADHRLWLGATRALWNDGEHIPQACRPVAGTALDFTAEATLGDRLGLPEPQLTNARGFNTLYLLRSPGMQQPAARLSHPASGRSLRLFTDLPAAMLYSGGFLHAGIALEGGGAAHPGCALALEPQLLPITPSAREASEVTTPEHPYDHRITYAFDTEA